ncbi:MAG TPA: alpha/beta fold hydrolase, partial [Friedmanniella sp.]
RVAPLLVDAGLSVVCADLPGYGRSGKPEPSPSHKPHAKTASARHLRAAMRSLGVNRFAVVGHDRGSYAAFRLALDHPDVVTRAALLDCIPVVEHLERCDARFATAWWHWFFFAQPGKPERAIGADPLAWYAFDDAAMGAENAAECRAAVQDPAVVRGMLEDYRAGLTVDADEERAARAVGARIRQPLLVLWSLRDDLEDLHGDPRLIWPSWADDVSGHGIDAPHHVAEHAPDELAAALVGFLLR